MAAMRRVAVGIAVVLAAGRAAAEPRASYADWAGDYRGKLTWSAQCTVAGAREATLAVNAFDGVLTIDLATARPGLRAMTLVEDDPEATTSSWSGVQGDLAVKLTRPTPGALVVVLESDLGCRMTGRLARPVIAIAACERLVGWARVESTCAARSENRQEDLAKLTAIKWRASDHEQCTNRADRLELALIDAGCAPHPDPAIGTRARNCLELSQAIGRLARCGKVPPPRIRQLEQLAANLRAAAHTATAATLPVVERECRDARALATAMTTEFHCP